MPAEAESALRLELANGSRLVSLPGTERTVRGYSGVALLVIDEAARVSDALYYSVRPMLAVSGGALLALTTPDGKRGWFYEAWSGAEPWRRVEVKARDCPRISPEFLREERRVLGRGGSVRSTGAASRRRPARCLPTPTWPRPSTPGCQHHRCSAGRQRRLLSGEGPDVDAPTRYFVGLDLGTLADYTAAVVLERPWALPGAPDPVYQLRHLHRWPLGTSYLQVAAGVAELLKRPPLPGCDLVVDATGAGRPVVEMINLAVARAQARGNVAAVTLTAGAQETLTARAKWNVAKLRLVSTLQAVLSSGRLAVAAVQHRDALRTELQNFRVKVTAAGNDSFEAWRERDHDDLVLATALAAWRGERLLAAERDFARRAEAARQAARHAEADRMRGLCEVADGRTG